MKFAIISSAIALVASGSALASVPELHISVLASGGASESWNTAGAATVTPGTYVYTGQHLGLGYASIFNMNGNDTSVVNRGLIGGAFSIINQGEITQLFSIDILIPTTAQGASSLIGGSVSAILTADQSAATFSSFGEAPIWSAMIQPSGNPAFSNVGTLLNGLAPVSASPFSISNIPGDSFGNPIPGLASIPMGDSMGIHLNFSLTAGDRIDFTTVFVVQSVPGPGAVALMGIVGAFGGRRRRG